MLTGKSDGAFTVSQNDVRAGDTPWAITLADVDLDGSLDAVVPNFLGGDASLLVGPDLTPWPPLEVGAHPVAVAVADLNGDGKPDVLTANQVSNTLGVLFNQGSSFMQQVAYPLRTAPSGIAVGDLNGDGATKLDAAIALPSLNVVRVLWGQGAGAFSDTQSVDLKVGQSPGALVLAKLNGDDLWDLVVTNRGDGTVSVLLGQAGGQFASAVAYATSTDPAGVAVGDVTGNCASPPRAHNGVQGGVLAADTGTHMAQRT